MRKHTKLFKMPLLVLRESENAASHDQAYEAGASDVLELSHGPTRLLPRLGHLVRQQRYCQATQEVYREGR
jgi:PleD family two-component response regulator